jgi:hypothetical protein
VANERQVRVKNKREMAGHYVHLACHSERSEEPLKTSWVHE